MRIVSGLLKGRQLHSPVSSKVRPTTDKLRSEIEKVENNEPLETNIDSFVAEINGLLDKISGKVSDSPEDKAPCKSRRRHGIRSS